MKELSLPLWQASRVPAEGNLSVGATELRAIAEGRLGLISLQFLAAARDVI
jgi:hypothetical protein